MKIILIFFFFFFAINNKKYYNLTTRKINIFNIFTTYKKEKRKNK